MFNLLRFFTITSFLVCITIATLLALFYRQTAVSSLIRESEQSNTALAQLLVNSVEPELITLLQSRTGSATDVLPPAQALESLRQALVTGLQDARIIKLKVYGLDGMTIFSTESRQIGEDQSLNPGFLAAKANQVRSELTHRDMISTFEGDRADRDVLATYMLIHIDNKNNNIDSAKSTSSSLVIELYSDVTELVTEIAHTERNVILVTSVAFALLLLGLWAIAGYANRILQWQHSQVKRAEAKLLLEKAALEEGIADRTLALEETNQQLEYQLNERRRAQEHLQKYSARLQILREIDRAVLAAQSPLVIARVALSHLRSHISCNRASIVVFDHARNIGEIVAVESDQPATQLNVGALVPLSSFPVIQRFNEMKDAANFKPEVMPVGADEQALCDENIHFRVQVPLVYLDLLVGALNLGVTSRDTLDLEALEMAGEIANSVAIALRQAHLNEQIRNHADAMQKQVEELQRVEADLENERLALTARVEQRTADLQAANTELEKAARLKDEFLASMSHELRTPLNAILAYTELLQSEIYGPVIGKQHNALHNIDEAGKHLLALISDILDVSKIAAQTLELEYSRFDVSALCERSIRMLRQSAEQKNINITFHLKQQVGTIAADERRLMQILTNFLSNALKFTPANGRIGLEVAWAQEGHRISFTVWDSGIGIAPEDLPRLFQPFVQLDARLSRNYSGTGLGLALASRLATLHGGEITVESKVSVGSRFTLIIPIAPKHTFQSVPIEHSNPGHQNDLTLKKDPILLNDLVAKSSLAKVSV